MEDQKQSPVVDAQAVSPRQLAYQRVYPELLALEGKPLLTINVAIPTVYSVATGVFNSLKPYKEKILKLDDIKTQLIEKAEDYLLTLGHTHSMLKAAEAPVASVPELYKSLLAERDLLISDCQALEKRGFMPAGKLAELRGPISHGDTAFDVIALVMILRGIWTSIQGKTALSLHDLERAETTADRLLVAVGERVMSGEQATLAALMRQRAFTLFAPAYEEWRRGMSHFRWHHGDLEQMVPSIYSGKMGRKRRDGREESDDTSEPIESGADADAPVGPAPAQGSAGSAANLPVGHPDSLPFTNN